MPKKNYTFEEKLIQLEEIINKLETGETNLDDSIALYEKGVSLAKECSVMLNEAQQKVNIISSEQ